GSVGPRLLLAGRPGRLWVQDSARALGNSRRPGLEARLAESYRRAWVDRGGAFACPIRRFCGRRKILSMTRRLSLAVGQLGPIGRSESRKNVVARLIALLERAKERGAALVVFPEMALTTFFPRWHIGDETELDSFFEREMPNEATRPLFEAAARL